MLVIFEKGVVMTIKQLMVDAIDLHVHGAPEPWEGERRVDTFQLAQQAKEAGMRVVVKCNQCGTATLTWMINKMVDSPVLLGSLVLNSQIGGLNPNVVESQVKAGAKLIWMPTHSAAEELEIKAREKEKIHGPVGAGKDPYESISLIGKDGKLVPQMGSILEIMRSNKVALATGHISYLEVFAVAREALRQRVNVIITHPYGRHYVPPPTMEQIRELVSMGAYIEFCFIACMPPARHPPEYMADLIKTIGPEHCVIDTDFGEVTNPPPTEGFRMMLANMLKCGLSEDELRIIVRDNPAKILGLT